MNWYTVRNFLWLVLGFNITLNLYSLPIENTIDQATQNWLKTHTKSCPVCNVRIERSKGCDYMQCTQCNYEFCWKCRGPHDHNMKTHKCRKNLNNNQLNKWKKKS